jgi:hypothetical protein
VLTYSKVVPDNTSAYITLEADGSVFIANNPAGIVHFAMLAVFAGFPPACASEVEHLELLRECDCARTGGPSGLVTLPNGTFGFAFEVMDTANNTVQGLAYVRVIPSGIPIYAGLAVNTLPAFSTQGGQSFVATGSGFKVIDTAFAVYSRADLGLSYNATVCVNSLRSLLATAHRLDDSVMVVVC